MRPLKRIPNLEILTAISHPKKTRHCWTTKHVPLEPLRHASRSTACWNRCNNSVLSATKSPNTGAQDHKMTSKKLRKRGSDSDTTCFPNLVNKHIHHPQELPLIPLISQPLTPRSNPILKPQQISWFPDPGQNSSENRPQTMTISMIQSKKHANW